MSVSSLMSQLHEANGEYRMMVAERDRLKAQNAQMLEAMRGLLTPYAYLTDRQLSSLKPNFSMGRVDYKQAQAIIAARAAIELAGGLS
jgi:hypothetical protein